MQAWWALRWGVDACRPIWPAVPIGWKAMIPGWRCMRASPLPAAMYRRHWAMCGWTSARGACWNRGGVTEVLSASHADRLWQARVEAGREFASGLAPFVALAVDGMRQGGFDEHSASGLGLRAPAHVRHVQRAEAGLAFRHRSDVFDLGAELSWQRLLLGAGTGFAAAFDGAPDTGLWVRGQPLPRDQAGLSLRALYRVRSRVGLYADVVAAAASGQVSQVTLNVGMRAGF